MNIRRLHQFTIAVGLLLFVRGSNAGEPLEPMTLQYRISQDQVAPSHFVAVSPDGMSLGLRVHWKLPPEDQKRLDDTIAKLERDGPNGKEFSARGVWLHKGFECDIYEITPKP